MSSSKTTSGIRVKNFGGPEVLQMDQSIPLPPLGDTQVIPPNVGGGKVS